MAQEDNKGFFDRLGEILNAPLPGTEKPTSPTQVAADDEDADSLMERIKDILNTPLPGTAEAEMAGEEAAGSTPQTVPTSGAAKAQAGQAGTAAPQNYEKTPELDEDELEEAWWQQDWAEFRAHQAREQNGLDLKQRRDQENFVAYQRVGVPIPCWAPLPRRCWRWLSVRWAEINRLVNPRRSISTMPLR
jgi:hypothetical protein